MSEGLDHHVRALFATAPDEFVAARNELVKALKRDDRRDDAATIAGLRRPSWIDGALNRTATVEPGPVAAFVDAAQSARRIQQADAEGRRTASLPDALRTVRAAQARLAKVADAALVGFGRKTDLAGVTARLAQIGADPADLDLLRAGVLGVGDELADTFATDDASEPGDTSEPGAPDADDAANRKAIDAATRAARAAEKDAQVAATAARRAAERRDRAAAAAEAAEAAVRDAERALEQARSELAEHETRAADAERASVEASEAASDAAARLDDLLD